jgi:hypothetical protein
VTDRVNHVVDSASDKPAPVRNRRRSIPKLIAGLIVVCCLPPLYVSWQSRRGDLATQADKIISLPDVYWYAWLNNQSLLAQRSNIELYNLNTTTSVSTPVPRYYKAIQNVKVAWPIALSPKGNMLLAGCFNQNGRFDLGCIPMNDDSATHWVTAEAPLAVWLDTNSFASLTVVSGNTVSLDKYSSRGVKSVLRTVSNLTGAAPSGYPYLLGVSNGLATGIGSGIFAGARTDVALFEIDTRDNTPAKIYKVALPEKSTFQSITLSPDGKQIAWLLVKSGGTFLEKLYRRIGIIKRGTVSTGLWVSNAKGEDIHCMGYMTTSGTDTGIIDDSLRWTPDGSHLSLSAIATCMY